MKDVSSPKWHFEEFELAEAPNETHVLVYRDLKECGDYLMGTPDFAGQLLVKPVVRTGQDDKTRVLTEMCDGDDWNKLQVGARSL